MHLLVFLPQDVIISVLIVLIKLFYLVFISILNVFLSFYLVLVFDYCLVLISF